MRFSLCGQTNLGNTGQTHRCKSTSLFLCFPVSFRSPRILPSWLSGFQSDVEQHTWHSYPRGEPKALHACVAFSRSTAVSSKATQWEFSCFYNLDFLAKEHRYIRQGPDSITWTHFLLSCFSQNCLKWVSLTHYFFTQRVCLLPLVFISINFMSAGLTQITTSLSCTFDLKIKLIWEVFKALLIFIWPLAVAMRLAGCFLKLEILLPILSLGLQLSFSDHIIFNILLRAQSRISHKVTEKLVLVFPPFILPILPSESDSHNTFLSLTSFRNSEAALYPTKVYGCRVTTKHYSSPSVSPPPTWTWTGQVREVLQICQRNTDVQRKGLLSWRTEEGIIIP